MSNDSQLEALQREWREGVTKKLDYLTEKIDNMPIVFANNIQFNQLKAKVEVLESFKNKTVGIIVGVQTVLTIIGYLIIHFH